MHQPATQIVFWEGGKDLGTTFFSRNPSWPCTKHGETPAGCKTSDSPRFTTTAKQGSCEANCVQFYHLVCITASSSQVSLRGWGRWEVVHHPRGLRTDGDDDGMPTVGFFWAAGDDGKWDPTLEVFGWLGMRGAELLPQESLGGWG